MSVFCLAPFKSIVVDTDGTVLPCCEFMIDKSKPTIKIHDYTKTWGTDYREAMISDTRLSECNHCISKEHDPNYKSLRQTFNGLYSGTEHLVEEIEIRFGNYCNLKCLMCGDYASSSIAAEYTKFTSEYNSVNMHFTPTQTVRWWENTETVAKLKDILKNVTKINFGGGEPLLAPESVELLNSLDVDKVKHVSINTNLTKLSDSALAAFRRLKRIGIRVSLEGIEQHNDYVRHGSSWAVIDKHINILKQEPTVALGFTHVLQHTSVYALPKLIAYAEEKNIPIMMSEVYYGSYPEPGVLTLNSVSPEIMGKFKDWLAGYNGRYKDRLSVWSSSYEFDSVLHEKFNRYVAMLDSIRQTNFKSTFRLDISH